MLLRVLILQGTQTIVFKCLIYLRIRYNCTISLKGIVQRKGPVALPSSGRKRTIWLSRVYASPEPSISAGKFGVVVKVLIFHHQAVSIGDRIRSILKFFSWEKKVKKSRVTSLPFLFPTKSCQIVASLTFKMESRERIIFVDSNEALRPQHTMHPAYSAQWLVRPAVNLHNITPFSLHQQLFFFKSKAGREYVIKQIQNEFLGYHKMCRISKIMC